MSKWFLPFPDRPLRLESSVYFEFFTTGYPVEYQSVEGLNAVKHAAVEVQLKPNGSVQAEFAKGRKNISPYETMSRLGRMPQVQLVDEPVAYLDRDTMLYEAWAPNHSHTGVYEKAWVSQASGEWSYMRSRDAGYGRGSLTAFNTRDILYDVPFQYGKKGGQVVTAYLNNQNSDWPRANGIQTVKPPSQHPEWGERKYGIYIDTFNQFHVFPLTAIGPEVGGYAQNIDANYVRRFDNLLPSWVYTNSKKMKTVYAEGGFEDVLLECPDFDWKVAKDGTKACAVVHERDPAYCDDAFYGPYVNGNIPQWWGMSQSVVNVAGYYVMGVGPRHDMAGTDGLHYKVAPGLIEVEITITITGAQQEEFSVDVNVVERRRPTSTPFCTLLAGYCWYKGVEGASPGDLCVLDVERWVGKQRGQFYKSFMVLRNLTTGQDIRTFTAAAVLDFDMPSLSFAMLERDDDWVGKFYNTWGSQLWYYGGSNEFLHWNSGIIGWGWVHKGWRYCSCPDGTDGGCSVDCSQLTDAVPLYLYCFDPYRNTVQGGQQWPWKAKTLTRHIAVSIFTLNHFREVICPDSMSGEEKIKITAAVSSDPRDHLPDNYTLLALNDPRDWNNEPKLKFLRDGLGIWEGGSWNDGGQVWHWPSGLSNLPAHPPEPRGSAFWPSWQFTISAGYPLDVEFEVMRTNARRIYRPAVLPPQAMTIPPDSETRNLLTYGLRTAGDCAYFLQWLATPRFGWYAYADEVIGRIQISPASTFFAHENGTWAFHCAQLIYNRNPTLIGGVVDAHTNNSNYSDYSNRSMWGVYYMRGFCTGEPCETALILPIAGDIGTLPTGTGYAMAPPDGRTVRGGGFYIGPYDPGRPYGAPMMVNTLEDFDAAKLEHCVFDRVHVQARSGTYKDTSFRELYNMAVAALPQPDPSLQHLAATQLKAVFTKEETNWASGDWYNDGSQWMHPVMYDLININTGRIDVVSNWEAINFKVLQLKVEWEGHTYKYIDQAYFNLPLPGLIAGQQRLDWVGGCPPIDSAGCPPCNYILPPTPTPPGDRTWGYSYALCHPHGPQPWPTHHNMLEERRCIGHPYGGHGLVDLNFGSTFIPYNGYDYLQPDVQDGHVRFSSCVVVE